MFFSFNFSLVLIFCSLVSLLEFPVSFTLLLFKACVGSHFLPVTGTVFVRLSLCAWLCPVDLLCFGILNPDREFFGNDWGSPLDALSLFSLPDFSVFTLEESGVPAGEDLSGCFCGALLLRTRLEVVLVCLEILGEDLSPEEVGELDRLGSRSWFEKTGFELLRSLSSGLSAPDGGCTGVGLSLLVLETSEETLLTGDEGMPEGL